MRLYPDRPDIETPGAWYWADEGIPFFPGFHAFGSRIWDTTEFPVYDPPIGEVSRGKWFNGQAPAWLKKGTWCGTRWETGIPYGTRPGLDVSDETGWPLCCPGPQPATLGLQGSAVLFQFVTVRPSLGLLATAQAGISWVCVPTRVMPRTLVVRFTVLSGGTCSALDNPVTATFNAVHQDYEFTIPTGTCPSGMILACNPGPTPLAVSGVGLCDNLNWGHGSTTTISITPFHVQHVITSSGFFCPSGMMVQLDITET
jgi:hypothetical protein